jgi:4'-phosphopantetheinyl transferase
LSSLFCGTVKISDPGKSRLEPDAGLGLNLFKIELQKYSGSLTLFSSYLDENERYRAHRYHFAKDKNRFIICRAVLKIALAEATDTALKDIRIETGPNKKPVLSSHPTVYFNVSHSGEYALIALGDRQVGVDVERVDREFDSSEITPRIFNPAELEALDRASDPKKQFFTFWTRKEAVLKATGKGIDDDVAHLPVTDGFHRLEPGILGNPADFVVLSFEVDGGHMGALAYETNLEEFDPKLRFSPLPMF